MPPIQLTTSPVIERWTLDLDEPGATKGTLRATMTAWAGNQKHTVMVVDVDAPIPLPADYFGTSWTNRVAGDWGGAGYVLPA